GQEGRELTRVEPLLLLDAGVEKLAAARAEAPLQVVHEGHRLRGQHLLHPVSLSRSMLDPDLASILLAFAFAGALGLPRLRKALRRGERFCESCGRRMLLGERTCDCDS